MRPSASTVLQSSASEAVLCVDEGGVQAGRGLLFRHFLFLRPNASDVHMKLHEALVVFVEPSVRHSSRA